MLLSASSLTKTHPDLLMCTGIKWNDSEKTESALVKYDQMLVSASSLIKTHPDLLNRNIKVNEIERRVNISKARSNASVCV